MVNCAFSVIRFNAHSLAFSEAKMSETAGISRWCSYL